MFSLVQMSFPYLLLELLLKHWNSRTLCDPLLYSIFWSIIYIPFSYFNRFHSIYMAMSEKINIFLNTCNYKSKNNTCLTSRWVVQMKKKALYFPVISTLELKILNYIVTIQCRLQYCIILNSSLDQNYQYYA